MTARVELERNQALLAWYGSRRRDLPWRGTSDAYRILVAEVMLQQTQASRVVPYYLRFLEQFPTAESLATAPLGEVLDCWSGLGYNTRAVRLRETARIVTAEGWPRDIGALQDLPGIGPYTAAAMASFAFGAKVPAVDTNLRRVLSRWHGEPLDGPLLMTVAAATLADDAGSWNQAMMDLGATVCRPRNPTCDDCPVEAWCAGPDGYVPAFPQARFEGSARHLRGAIVRAVVREPHTFEDLRRETGFGTTEIEMALEDLVTEGLVAETETGYTVGE